jgi:Arc/MetJ family transcription regulator
MRTAVNISEELITRAIQISGLKTEQEVIETAISEFIAKRTRKDLSELKGKIKFAPDYDYKALRAGTEK